MKSAPFRLIATVIVAAHLTHPARAVDNPLAWPPVTNQTKPWVYNWWMASAVDKPNLTRELERYQKAGLGGIHIIPIYGAKGFERQYINYLSPEWIDMMGWAVTEARRLGMDTDMTTGSGWCFGGPWIIDAHANAVPVVTTHNLAAGQPFRKRFDPKSVQALVAYEAQGKAVELTNKLAPDGTLDYVSPSGATLYEISQKPSGQKVKRPGPGGEGWMLNLLEPAAMDAFLTPFTEAFNAYKGPKPRAQYHDSYEYKSEWSPSFFTRFEKRRGYSLKSELPALFGQSDDDHAARLKCDYRRTVSDIIIEESMPKWAAWSRERGFLTRNEAHGAPGNWLDLYALADIPETEMFHLDRSKLISKFASSAAHVSGKRLVSAETGTWLAEHFTETLADTKWLLDDLFLSGVNHIFYHGCCYSPDAAPWPGWLFYASLQMNPRNPIWRDALALNAYATRCQSVLQSGSADNDILLYWPLEDFWMKAGGKLLTPLTVHAREWFEDQPVGKTAARLWERGYAFDYVSDRQLAAASAIGGSIRVPGGQYRAVVVPKCDFIPLETFRALAELARAGATVIFADALPADLSGGGALDARRELFRKVRLSVETSPNFRVGPLDAALEAAKVPRENLTDSGLSCVRRSFDGGWHYFIANRSKDAFDGKVVLARQAAPIGLMDPLTGEAGLTGSRITADGLTEFPLRLAPGGSVIVRGFATAPSAAAAWTVWHPAGPPVPVSGPWRVRFVAGGAELPDGQNLTLLQSWTTFADPRTQAFAGTAVYETTFDAPNSGGTYELDLGRVCQSARVTLNGTPLGTLITPPFRVIASGLKPTGNTLSVEVTSVAANRIRDLDRRGVKWRTFHDINLVNIDYKPFDASNWPIADCGLLGPVSLTPMTAAAR